MGELSLDDWDEKSEEKNYQDEVEEWDRKAIPEARRRITKLAIRDLFPCRLVIKPGNIVQANAQRTRGVNAQCTLSPSQEWEKKRYESQPGSDEGKS